MRSAMSSGTATAIAAACGGDPFVRRAVRLAGRVYASRYKSTSTGVAAARVGEQDAAGGVVVLEIRGARGGDE